MRAALAIVIASASLCAEAASSSRIQPGHQLIRPNRSPSAATSDDTERLQELRGYSNPHKYREDAQADLLAEGKKLTRNLNALKNPSTANLQGKSIKEIQFEVEASRNKIRVLNSELPNMPSRGSAKP